jgi:ATP-binding protein involved in chromosome partitioning
MVQTALRQFLEDVLWGELDVLVLDMPPGTGDAQLTIAQKLDLSGAVIVSTPQDIALLDARKGINMFRKTNVPILGIVENMSYYHCPNCHHEAHIFGHGGAEEEAGRLGVPFLGRIPLHADIRLKSDEGMPAVLAGGAEAEAFRALAGAVAAALGEAPYSRASQG